jgi:hypothetical protein
MLNNNIEMCKLNNPCTCKECGNNMLFFLTDRNTLIDYSRLFSNGATSPKIYRELQKVNVRFIKCLVCNKCYLIDWSEKFPKQLIDRKTLNKFGV